MAVSSKMRHRLTVYLHCSHGYGRDKAGMIPCSGALKSIGSIFFSLNIYLRARLRDDISVITIIEYAN